MKPSLTALLILLSCIGIAQEPSLQWAVQSSSPDQKLTETIRVDGEGNTLVVIRATAPYTFAGQLIPHVSSLSGFSSGPTLIKLGPEGNVLWQQSLLGPWQWLVQCRGLEVDEDNNIYLSYIGHSNVINSSTIGGLYTFSPRPVDHFLVKLSPEGNGIWYKIANVNTNVVGGLLTSTIGGGGLYTIGPLDGTVNYGGVGLSNTGMGSTYLVKHDLDGNVQWGKVLGNNLGWVEGWNLIAGSDGSVYVSGTWEGESMHVDDFSIVNDLFFTGNYDRWICKIDSEGTAQWLAREHSAALEWLSHMALTSEGELLVLSEHREDVLHVGDFTLSEAGMVLSRYSPGGEVLSAAVIGDLLNYDNLTSTFNWEYFPSIVADGSGAYYVVGAFLGSSFQFGGITIANSGGNTGTGDIFVARIDEMGQAEWLYHFGSPESEAANMIDVSHNNAFVIAGGFAGLELNIQGSILLPHTSFEPENFVASFNTTLATRSAQVLKQLLVYPNPFSENVHFDAEALQAFQNATLTVYNSSGAEVYHAAFTGHEAGHIRLGHLPTGAYVARINDGTKSIHTKIVKY